MENMKKIVTITGHKHTKKGIIATELARNSDVEYVRPYTARSLPKDIEPSILEAEYNVVLPSVLDDMMKKEKVLAVTEIGKHKYVYFEFQFRKPYSVIIADDYAVVNIKSNWDGKIFTIRAVSDKEEPSERVDEFLYKHEFDTIFDYERDDIYELEHLIGEENG